MANPIAGGPTVLNPNKCPEYDHATKLVTFSAGSRIPRITRFHYDIPLAEVYVWDSSTWNEIQVWIDTRSTTNVYVRYFL